MATQNAAYNPTNGKPLYVGQSVVYNGTTYNGTTPNVGTSSAGTPTPAAYNPVNGQPLLTGATVTYNGVTYIGTATAPSTTLGSGGSSVANNTPTTTTPSTTLPSGSNTSGNTGTSAPTQTFTDAFGNTFSSQAEADASTAKLDPYNLRAAINDEGITAQQKATLLATIPAMTTAYNNGQIPASMQITPAATAQILQIVTNQLAPQLQQNMQKEINDINQNVQAYGNQFSLDEQSTIQAFRQSLASMQNTQGGAGIAGSGLAQ